MSSQECPDKNCGTCSLPISYQHNSKSLLSESTTHFSTYNPYTLDLVIRIITRKCSDEDFMGIERVKWSCPWYTYVRSIQLCEDNPINLVIQNKQDTYNQRAKLDRFYATNFARIVTEQLQKTYVNNIDDALEKIQKDHKIMIKKISIVLNSKDTEFLNKLLTKYISPKVINEISKINEQM